MRNASRSISPEAGLPCVSQEIPHCKGCSMIPRYFKSASLVAAIAVTLAAPGSPGAHAATPSRADTLRSVTGGTTNTLDPTMPCATRPAFGVSMSTYDRLFAFGTKVVNGHRVFDPNNLRGELSDPYR